MLNTAPDYSVANAVLLSDLFIGRSSLISLAPFFHGVVSAEPCQLALTFLTASQLGFAPGEHFFLAHRAIFKFSPSHSRAYRSRQRSAYQHNVLIMC